MVARDGHSVHTLRSAGSRRWSLGHHSPIDAAGKTARTKPWSHGIQRITGLIVLGSRRSLNDAPWKLREPQSRKVVPVGLGRDANAEKCIAIGRND